MGSLWNIKKRIIKDVVVMTRFIS